ncbi:tagaturonate reductase [Foetidibacter luteolus]|uniref:tagaturonate reductase n=1 Tax=Foetidibacter luteolus TaxID=2608880 RepID=UPI00129A1CCC|nr:tagaturonate reductase [Foetidibacter luteolus]
MQLQQSSISSIGSGQHLSVPGTAIFSLPEKVIVFGTGVLLRGLPCYYIDKANKQGIFNGRAVMVKSTGADVEEFARQDSLYTHCIKGFENGNLKEEYNINASVSRTLSAITHWDELLRCATNPGMKIIISNTTEVGITLLESDRVDAQPPVSFPGKLLAFLYKRYQHFAGSKDSGMVIIPTELLVDNGAKLRDILVQLSRINSLEEDFMAWLTEANDFCNSLVDRIVPGALSPGDQQQLQQLFGYEDKLGIMSETYSLWAIETQREETREILSFSQADAGVVITNNINKFRELKLRLLNGTHTFSCGYAFLSGFNLVSDAMNNDAMRSFITNLAKEEIAPCITGSDISEAEALAFADDVISRFSNPYIQHKWLSITMQYSGKMKMRNIPLILKRYSISSNPPNYMAMGFAAYLLFMKAVQEEDGKYYGERNGEGYWIQDEKAATLHAYWLSNTPAEVVGKTLADESLWGTDLTLLPGFADAVTHHLEQLVKGNSIDAVDTAGQGV